MRRCAALALLALLAAAPATARQSQQQSLFTKTLLADAKTSADVKALLRSGRGFVEPSPVFADVTGDGKTDALVRGLDGGAAGGVAAYVLSTDGTKSSSLRVVMRNQRLYRATLKVDAAHDVVLRTPIYAPGDTLCCPSRARDRTYAWNAKTKTMRRVSSVEFPLT